MKTIYVVVFFLMFFCVPAKSLTISPPIINLQSQINVPSTTQINILNEKPNKNYNIKVYATDITFDKSGKRVYKKAGLIKNSFAKYLTISPSNFNLYGYQSQTVKVTLNLPPTISGGNSSMIYFEATPILKIKSKQKVVMKMAVGALLIQQTAGKSNIKSKIKNIIVKPMTETKPLRLEVEVSNEGNAHIWSSATASIFDENDKYIGVINIPKILLFPGRSDMLSGEWDGNLKTGKYYFLVTYQYSDTKSITIKKPFEIKV